MHFLLPNIFPPQSEERKAFPWQGQSHRGNSSKCLFIFSVPSPQILLSAKNLLEATWSRGVWCMSRLFVARLERRLEQLGRFESVGEMYGLSLICSWEGLEGMAWQDRVCVPELGRACWAVAGFLVTYEESLHLMTRERVRTAQTRQAGWMWGQSVGKRPIGHWRLEPGYLW